MNIFDNIIAWSPHILHFKGLGMRNLQYEMRICQKSHNKITKPVFSLCMDRIFMNQTLGLYCQNILMVSWLA